MKKILMLFYIAGHLILKSQPCSFSVNALANNFTITCKNPTVYLNAEPAYLSYTWASLAGTVFSSNQNCQTPDTYTVFASGIGCTTSSQTISVDIFTTTPSTTVNPLSQVVICNSGAPATFSGIVSNPSLNIVQEWYSPLNPLPAGVPIASTSNTLCVLTGEFAPGVYTVVATNKTNGCKSMKTTTITSLAYWPTFSMVGNPNFSIGCSPQNVTLTILNPVSTQTPPAMCDFSFVPPGFSLPSPSIALNNITSTVTAIAGTWTVIVRDLSNNCRTMLPLPITINTIAPTIMVFPNNASSCPGSSVTFNAFGSNSYTWNPGEITGPMIVSSPASDIIYTISALGINGCASTMNFTHSVLPTPSINIVSSTSSLCVGYSATLTSSGANTYTWDPGGTNGSSLVISPSVTTVYTVTCTGSLVCNGIANYQQLVLPCTNIKNNINEIDSENLAFPNPNDGNFNLKIGTEYADLYFTLSNSIGQVLHEQKVTFGMNTINTNQLTKGIYFFSLTSKSQIIKNGKISID